MGLPERHLVGVAVTGLRSTGHTQTLPIDRLGLSTNAMKKTAIKRMFKAIQDGDTETLDAILDSDPDALETVGEHNRNVRDKTPLMFAMQCNNQQLAHALIDRGANVDARMAGGPR